MNREILEKPFSPEQIKQREGSSGKMLDYIEGHAVIQRLNDAFDGDWSFTITRHEILKDTDEVVVIGELKAGNVVKTQFGSSRITRARESGEIISLADDLKAAATDALKKSATLLGVGLHLYSHKEHRTTPRPDYPPRSNNGGNGSKGGNGNGRLTANQYKYILDLNEERGGNQKDLDQRCLGAFGTVVQHLSRTDASSLIQEMLSS
jgi:hypothetical protein